MVLEEDPHACTWSRLRGSGDVVEVVARRDGQRFVLGLPTGSTPIGVYKRLVEFCDRGELSFANVVTFNSTC